MSRKIVAAIRDTRHTSMEDVEHALADLGVVSRADVLRALDALLEPTTLPSESYKLACSFFIGVVKACPDRALFAPLARALPKAMHAAPREALVHALPIVNHLADHAILVSLLRSPEDSTRAAALRVLEKVAVGPTFEALVAEFRSGPFTESALVTMVQLVDKLGARAVPVLAGAVQSADARMVAAGLEAVARCNDLLTDRAVFAAAARARMRDADDEIAGAATLCWAAIAESEDAFVDGVLPVIELGGERAVCAALKGVARFPSLRTLGLLEQRLMRGPSRISIVALQVLQEIGTDDVLAPLVSAISHRRQRVRTEAVRVLKALAAQGRVDMARAILFLLRSRDPNVRRMASEVLQAMSQQGSAIWPRLVSFIRDEDWWVRERLADALVPMAGAALIPHLMPYLDDDASTMRRFAVQVLGRIGHGDALGALLIRARDDADWLVREEAVRAIGRVGDDRAVPYLVKLVEAPGLEIAGLDALRQLKRDDARGMLPNLLSRPERDVRMAALRYAQSIEANDQIDAVALLLHDVDPEIARTAASTLRAWHYGGAADPALDEAGRVLAELLRKVVKSDGSDLILVSGRAAFMKRQGRVERLTRADLTAENVYELLAPLFTPEQVEALAHKTDVDFSHENRRVGARFRVNAFQSEDGLGAVFRVIKGDVVPLEELGVPALVHTFAELQSGLVLFGGPPGSGKSTTLAGIVNRINETRSRHIISIEDPIEGVHASRQSLVTQREVGVHTTSYGSALRAALREDPDVILVGELRDLETISFAVTAAETGHLVFGTVHAVAADTCVERVINAFPHERQAQIRTMLSETLKAVVCQHLVPRRDGGRVLACEVMLNNESIANMIRKGQGHQIASQMVLQRELGMSLMDDSLFALLERGIIDPAEAYVKARDKGRFPIADESAAVAAREVAVAPPTPSTPSTPAPSTPARTPTPAPRLEAPPARPPTPASPGLPRPDVMSPAAMARARIPPGDALPRTATRPSTPGAMASTRTPSPVPVAAPARAPAPRTPAPPPPARAQPARVQPAAAQHAAPPPAAARSAPARPAPAPVDEAAPPPRVPTSPRAMAHAQPSSEEALPVIEGTAGDEGPTMPLPTIEDADDAHDTEKHEVISPSGVRPAMKGKP